MNKVAIIIVGPSGGLLPRTLVVWGKHDFVFLPAGAEAYRKDLDSVELHFLDAGHFALETHAPEIAGHMRKFLSAAL